MIEAKPYGERRRKEGGMYKYRMNVWWSEDD
jgi:hypothetical protein